MDGGLFQREAWGRGHSPSTSSSQSVGMEVSPKSDSSCFISERKISVFFTYFSLSLEMVRTILQTSWQKKLGYFPQIMNRTEKNEKSKMAWTSSGIGWVMYLTSSQTAWPWNQQTVFTRVKGVHEHIWHKVCIRISSECADTWFCQPRRGHKATLEQAEQSRSRCIFPCINIFQSVQAPKWGQGMCGVL